MKVFSFVRFSSPSLFLSRSAEVGLEGIREALTVTHGFEPGKICLQIYMHSTHPSRTEAEVPSSCYLGGGLRGSDREGKPKVMIFILRNYFFFISDYALYR